MAKKNGPIVCRLTSFRDACLAFVQPSGKTQSAGHVKPMHWYVACRLVIEGGFDPDNVKPHPPLRVEHRKGSKYLVFDETVATGSEATVFGGLKTKDIDVVVALPGIGPCIAVSMKGTMNAFRNLTNRMEEAVGDCTNIHIAYPGLVYAFLTMLRASKEGPIPPTGAGVLTPDPKTGLTKTADTALRLNGDVTAFISGYHDAMARLAGRRDLRDDQTRYEAIGMLLLSPEYADLGSPLVSYPPADSLLSFQHFFPTIYRQYDLRFVYGAPNLRTLTRRHFWHPDSQALELPAVQAFVPRVRVLDEFPIDEQDSESGGDEESEKDV